MAKTPASSTPQFKTALIRKLKNIEPEFDVEFFETNYGISFRMIDSMKRPRSEKISAGESALQTSTLRWLLKRAGFPGKHFE